MSNLENTNLSVEKSKIPSIKITSPKVNFFKTKRLSVDQIHSKIQHKLINKSKEKVLSPELQKYNEALDNIYSKELNEISKEEEAVLGILEFKTPKNPYNESMYDMIYSKYKLIPSNFEPKKKKYVGENLGRIINKNGDKVENIKRKVDLLKDAEFIRK